MSYRREIETPSTIEFFGAAEDTVTGSCTRLHFGDPQDPSIMVDGGLFQSHPEQYPGHGINRNITPAREIVKGVSHLMVTHVHIDHSGRISFFVKSGFEPRILVSRATSALIGTMLENSAEIQKREKTQLYDKYDVAKTLRLLRVVEPFEEVHVGKPHSRITAEFIPNGHVMGSGSWVVRSINKSLEMQTILAMGDSGKPHQSQCGGYLDLISEYPKDPVHVLITESTNSLTEPVSFQEKSTNFFNSIHEVWRNGGNPLLPVLSFHRLQEVLEMLHNNQGGLIPEDCRICIYAPLGMAITQIFEKLDPDEFSNQYGDDMNYYKTPEECMGRYKLRHVEIIDSHQKALDLDNTLAEFRGKAIVIASGGMAEHGGAIPFIQGKFCQNPKNGIIFTCYQVEGTKGAEMVRLGYVKNGKEKGAVVKKVEGFTSHGTRDQIFDYIERYNLDELNTVFITHGKDKSREAMAAEFQRRGYKANIILPNLGQEIKI